MNRLAGFYAKLFRRSFLKNKSHFLLNLAGLTLGISCFLFSLLYFIYETSYDNYHVNRDRIARIVTTVVSGGNVMHTALSNGFLAPNLPKLYPRIETMVRFKPFQGRAAIRTINRGEAFTMEKAFYSDSDVFKVFSYPLREGDRATCLSAPNTIVLSRQTAKKLFGQSAALNALVTINDQTLKVTGIMDDLPGNSDITFDGLISWNTLPPAGDDGFVYSYALLKSSSGMAGLQADLDSFTTKYLNPQLAKSNTAFSYKPEPLSSLHFSNSYVYDTPKSNKVSLDIFLTLGILILVIACTNSINMMVVRSFARSMEVTMQKIYGAGRRELILQQLLESLIVGVIAVVLSLVLVWLLLPAFGTMVDRAIILSDLLNWKTGLALGAALIVLAGSGAVYSGLYLQRVNLADLLRSKSNKGQGMRIVPKMILGFQFFISIGMIVAGLLVFRQVRYLQSIPLGFDATNVLVAGLPQGVYAVKGDDFLKNQLSADPGVLKLALCGEKALPGQFADFDVMTYRANGMLVNKGVNDISVDENYLSLLGVSVIAGSGFQPAKDSNARHQVIVTELFARQAGWEHPIGQTITEGDDKVEVVGVVKDFHFNSLHHPVAPMVIFQAPDEPAYLMVKVANHQTGAVVRQLQKAWGKAFPAFPFAYFSLDEHLLQQYKDEGNLLTLLISLSLLVIAISCMGLIAYTSYIVRMAMTDIAIRRIIGASFRDIFNLFNRQFVLLLVIGLSVAVPVSWYLLGRWLEQFAYHVGVRPIDYLIATGAMAAIVGGVVLRYIARCIRVSPAKIIREQ
jgi:putative ABC transport system permease protein